jgi:hypothetical protein
MKITRTISPFPAILSLLLSLPFDSSSQINTTQRRPDNNMAMAPFPPDPCTDPRLPCPIDDGVVLLIAAAVGLAALKARAKRVTT